MIQVLPRKTMVVLALGTDQIRPKDMLYSVQCYQFIFSLHNPQSGESCLDN